MDSSNIDSINSFEVYINQRPEKGKSLLSFPDDFVIIDVETTGLDFSYSDIIEVACVRVVNGEMKDNYTSFVHIDYSLPEYITSLTGITDDMLKDAPEISNVILNLSNFVGNSILVGHNINFDVNFVYDSMLRSLNKPLCNDFVDTLRLCRRMLPDLPHHRLSDMAEYFNISVDTSHRSLSDCVTTYFLFYKLYNLASVDGDADAYLEQFRHSHKKRDYNKRLSEIKANTAEFDVSHPFYGKTVVFTGELEKFTRSAAMQIVVNIGGFVSDSITKNTHYLVLGNQDYRKINGEKSRKHIKAESYILKGCDLQIIPEDTFYSLVLES